MLIEWVRYWNAMYSFCVLIVCKIIFTGYLLGIQDVLLSLTLYVCKLVYLTNRLIHFILFDMFLM